jgi:integrase
VIEKRKRRGRDGTAYHVYRVRYYDDDGQERSVTLPRGTAYDDAQAMDAKLKLLKRAGELPELRVGKETLATFAEEWWEIYAGPNLARNTLGAYAQVWNKHVLPRLGHYRLRELTPEIVARFRADLERDGVGAPTVRKALSMLQGMLSRAVEWRRIRQNPADGVRKPVVRSSRPVLCLAPARVELIRSHLLGSGERGDATFVSVLAYAGPRPAEALSLRWEDLGDRTLRVHATKTARRTRTVRLLAPLRQDLHEWRMAAGVPGSRELIFPNHSDQQWADHDYRNWRRRTFQPAAAACGLPDLVPYDLRHSFASLLIHEGCSVVEVADQLGHSPQMTLSTYAHVMSELDGAERVSAEDQIRAARETGLGNQPSLGAM